MIINIIYGPSKIVLESINRCDALTLGEMFHHLKISIKNGELDAQAFIGGLVKEPAFGPAPLFRLALQAGEVFTLNVSPGFYPIFFVGRTRARRCYRGLGEIASAINCEIREYNDRIRSRRVYGDDSPALLGEVMA
jgi:hypothetical protein